MIMKTFLNIALLLMLTISVIGCSSDSIDEPAAGGTEMVNFSLSVYAGDPDRQSSSRVGALPGDDYFEQPQTQYERMRTLRVIIVRPDGTVEHNEYLYRTIPDEGLGQYNNVQLKVHGGETKRIYLFANEASMFTSGNELPPYDFNSIKIGSKFPADEVAALQLNCESGKPLVDNTGTEKTYIPMSEMFDIDVKAPQPDGTDLYQSADLFITRAAVKFSFHVSTPQAPEESFIIEEFAIETVSSSEYLLPKDATYVPAKYPVYFADRYIKSYSTPEGVQNSKISFYPNMEFTPTTPVNIQRSFAPAVYFPESAVPANGKFVVKMRLKGDTNYRSQAELPNLPSLPRNTHVKINVTLEKGDLKCQVDVLPYAAVPLNPEFGFDELLPRPPVIGEQPPWIVIPGDEDDE